MQQIHGPVAYLVDMRPARLALLSSVVVWIVFYVGSFAALGSSYPTIESSGEEIVEWFTDNGGGARFYAWTATIISVALAVFGAQIASLLPKPNRYLLFAGVLGWVVAMQVQAWFWAGLALRPEGLDPGAARTLFDIPQYVGPVINGSTMTMALAFIPLGFGASTMIPRWLAWLSVLFFAEQGIETITVFGQSGFIAPGGTMNVYLGGVIGVAWVIGVLVWGMKQLDAPADGAAAPDTPSRADATKS